MAIAARETTLAHLTVGATTVWKVQVRIIPFIFLLFVVAFLDRINIGFAALTMNKELALSSQQFGFLAGVFFFGYCIFEVPSNLLLHKIGARIWIARILLTWGMVAILTGFVQSAGQLYVARFILGVAEAGYFPGMLLYLTYWFRQRERAQAIALLLTGLPFTSILGAPVSGFILDRVHWLSLSSWRWLLILEAVPAILGGVLTYLFLPSRPSEAKFLTQEEKHWITGELERDDSEKSAQHRVSTFQVFTNARVWHLCCIGFFVNIGMYTLSFWTPQVVKAFAHQSSNSIIGLLVMIPHLVGLVVMVLVSRSSDRKLERRFHAAIPACTARVAFICLSATHSLPLGIVFLSFAALGIYSIYGPYFSLPSEFLAGFAAASGLAFINSVGNLAGFVGPYLIGVVSRKMGSLSGSLIFAGFPLLVASALILLFPKRVHSSLGNSVLAGINARGDVAPSTDQPDASAG
jgi:ACS family tartrate transporter-like MFS transporter